MPSKAQSTETGLWFQRPQHGFLVFPISYRHIFRAESLLSDGTDETVSYTHCDHYFQPDRGLTAAALRPIQACTVMSQIKFDLKVNRPCNGTGRPAQGLYPAAASAQDIVYHHNHPVHRHRVCGQHQVRVNQPIHQDPIVHLLLKFCVQARQMNPVIGQCVDTQVTLT